MQNKLIALLVLLTVIVPAAAGAQVYTWTDSAGTVHYSDAPPPKGTKYSQVKVKTAPTSASNPSHAPSSAADAKAQASAKPSDKQVADTPSNRKSVCDRLSSNIALLKSGQALNASDANGKLHAMSQKERTTQLDREQSQYHQYCQH